MKITTVLTSTFALFLSLCFVLSDVYSAEDFVPNEIRTEPGALKEGEGHVQGIACDENAIYVVFTNYVYKLDWTGKVVKGVPAVRHSGDPCVANGKLYVSMSTDDRNAVYEYDLDLNLTRKLKLENCPASDGIAFLDGLFYIGGPSMQEAHEDNLVLVYDDDFKFVKQANVNFGVPTNFGPQSIAAWNGRIFYAFYIDDAPKGSPCSMCADPESKTLATFDLDGSNGWALAPDSKQPKNADKAPVFLVGYTVKENGETVALFQWRQFDSETSTFIEFAPKAEK